MDKKMTGLLKYVTKKQNVGHHLTFFQRIKHICNIKQDTRALSMCGVLYYTNFYTKIKKKD